MLTMSSVQDSLSQSESSQDVSYRWLKERIVTLPRNEGTFLTEAEVARATGMSRTPVREALLRLETEGFLQIFPKRGAFVPPISDAEVDSVMQARGLVEGWCVREATASSPGLLDELERLVIGQLDLLEAPVAFIARDRVFHGTIVRAAGNPILTDLYESLRERQLRMGLWAVTGSADRARVVVDEHQAIVTALRQGKPDLAAVALETHLANTLSALQRPTDLSPHSHSHEPVTGDDA